VIVSKLDAARIQLDRAIQCFFDGDHVSTITLGEAAKEILDTLLEINGKQSSTQFLLAYYQENIASQTTIREFKKELNTVKNWLKHADKDPNTQCEIEKRDGIFTLMQTIPCYQKYAHQCTVEMERFHQYHSEHKDEIDAIFITNS